MASGLLALAYRTLLGSDGCCSCYSSQMAAWAEGVEQILLEERSSPTVRYDGTNNATKVALAFSSPSASPQRVQEDTRAYEFKSVNYQLLSSLSAQFDEKENAGIRLHLMRRMSDVNAIKKNWSTAYPSWNDYTSELPLVAEFLIRTGHSVDLFLHALFVL